MLGTYTDENNWLPPGLRSTFHYTLLEAGTNMVKAESIAKKRAFIQSIMTGVGMCLLGRVKAT